NGLRLQLLRGEHAAARGAGGVDTDAVEVARQLLDGVDRPDALDLHGDPAVVLVAAHEVDRADVGRPLALHEPESRLDVRRVIGEQELEVALDAVLLEAAASPMSCVTSESTSCRRISSRSSLRPAR